MTIDKKFLWLFHHRPSLGPRKWRLRETIKNNQRDTKFFFHLQKSFVRKRCEKKSKNRMCGYKVFQCIKRKKVFEIFFLWKQFRFFSRGDFKIQELFYLVYLKKKLTLRRTKAILAHGQTQFFFIDSLNRSKFNFCCVPFVCFYGFCFDSNNCWQILQHF